MAIKQDSTRTMKVFTNLWSYDIVFMKTIKFRINDQLQ